MSVAGSEERRVLGRKRVIGFSVIAFAGLIFTVCYYRDLVRSATADSDDSVGVGMNRSGGRSPDSATVTTARDDWTHDFGVVPPNSVVSWAYPIQNVSDFPWTIDKVEVVCRCTVPGVSTPVIAPGKQGMVALQLDCPDEVGDIVKSATVRFKEPEAQPITLSIKASVRAPMTPSVREVSFGGVNEGEVVEQAIELSNYSDADWRELHVDGVPAWAEVAILPHRAPPLPQKASAGNGRSSRGDVPRQVWQATVKFSAAGLAEGYCQAPFTVRSNTGDECQVHVSANLVAPVRIVPNKLVFGPGKTGESFLLTARVIFGKSVDSARIEARASSDSVSVKLRKLNEKSWEISATLIVPPDSQLCDGQIQLSFPGTSLADATLPYSFFRLAAAK